MSARPIVLCIGGHDPSGGAGIQADIETVSALGGRAISLVTALTAQDTHNVAAVWPTARDTFARQMDTLLADIRPDAIKLGLLASVDIAGDVALRLDEFNGPVIVDPVLAAGGGRAMSGHDIPAVIGERIIPLSTLVTPNRAEASALTGNDDPEQAAAELLDAGAGCVLLTGTDNTRGETVRHRLYLPTHPPQILPVPRLNNSYHGSGCTLASACAINLALGQPLRTAIDNALSFTRQALEHAERPGSGQSLPQRIRL
jgi:hydroxymethylpyrimidine/phosphomethylpyrimidine kinase